MNITEATDKACEEPTLAKALSWICIWETERIIKQYKKNLDAGTTEANGGMWETLFKHCIQNVMGAYKESGKWSKELPNKQGWYWYRKNDRCYAVPTFIEDCGAGKFKAVEVYSGKMVYLTDTSVEWWPEKINQPK